MLVSSPNSIYTAAGGLHHRYGSGLVINLVIGIGRDEVEEPVLVIELAFKRSGYTN